jgi:hypothetical protein
MKIYILMERLPAGGQRVSAFRSKPKFERAWRKAGTEGVWAFAENVRVPRGGKKIDIILRRNPKKGKRNIRVFPDQESLVNAFEKAANNAPGMDTFHYDQISNPLRFGFKKNQDAGNRESWETLKEYTGAWPGDEDEEIFAQSVTLDGKPRQANPGKKRRRRKKRKGRKKNAGSWGGESLSTLYQYFGRHGWERVADMVWWHPKGGRIEIKDSGLAIHSTPAGSNIHFSAGDLSRHLDDFHGPRGGAERQAERARYLRSLGVSEGELDDFFKRMVSTRWGTKKPSRRKSNPKVWALWHGGYSYAHPNVIDDLESFDSLADAKIAFEQRYRNWGGDTPVVDESATMMIFHEEPGDDPYPDKIITVSRRGTAKVERVG